MTSEIENVAATLSIRSGIQNEIVDILRPLKGYSKRRDLLERELHSRGYSIEGIRSASKNMLNIGLLETTEHNSGIRYRLVKDVWDADVKLVQAIYRLAKIAGRERRSDTTAETIVKEVRRKINERLPTIGTRKLFNAVVYTALVSSPEWRQTNGKLVRANSKSWKHKDISEREQGQLFSSASGSKKSSLTKQHSRSDVQLPANVDFLTDDLSDAMQSISQQLNELNLKVRLNGHIAEIIATLPFNRHQTVYVIARKDAMYRRVFWVYTLCGEEHEVTDGLGDIILKYNNTCDPVRVTILEFASKRYLGCCAAVLSDIGWEKELVQIIALTSNKGDEIERRHWDRDIH